MIKRKVKGYLYRRKYRLLNQRIRNCAKYDRWRARVKKRDNHKCVECGGTSYRLEVHHINPFTLILKKYGIKSVSQAIKCTALWDLKNGMTLCLPCHKLTDSYMKRNITSPQNVSA